ncbi:MAG: acyltransferase family protein [Muribaculaceae bacterium]|nr:acyltransferase family protein [Muribaculaceae bacterium]
MKGIFIMLMVIFHLRLVEITYPLTREAVYTFHMSAFMLISGYLANIHKRPRTFSKSVLRLALPYVLFEMIYVLMVYWVGKSLHANNTIDHLSVIEMLKRLATQPTGPYWYLHTLIVCLVIYYISYKALKLKSVNAFLFMSLALFGVTRMPVGIEWKNVIYFLIGVLMNRSGRPFMDIIKPSWLALLPLGILFCFPAYFKSWTLPGIVITLLVISFLLWTYPVCGKFIRRVFCYLGRNSLSIVVFSAIFTVLTKSVSGYFSFDPTALSFLVCATVFVMAGCLICAWICDKVKLSRFIFLKEKIYVPFSETAKQAS